MLTDIRARLHLLAQSDFEIVSQFNAELRGFANYYALAPKFYLNKWMAHTGLYNTKRPEGGLMGGGIPISWLI